MPTDTTRDGRVAGTLGVYLDALPDPGPIPYPDATFEQLVNVAFHTGVARGELSEQSTTLQLSLAEVVEEATGAFLRGEEVPEVLKERRDELRAALLDASLQIADCDVQMRSVRRSVAMRTAGVGMVERGTLDAAFEVVDAETLRDRVLQAIADGHDEGWFKRAYENEGYSDAEVEREFALARKDSAPASP